MQVYAQAIQTVQLWGPTLFTPTIKAAMQYAKQHVSQYHQKYYVLLIITDGIITGE